MKYFICWLKGKYYSLCIGLKGSPHDMDGHELEEVETIKNANVTIMQCRKCGKYSISWSRV